MVLHPSSFVSCSFMILSGARLRMRDNSDTLPLLTNPYLPPYFRQLPVVDVGANDGRDYTLPAALLGHRVYSFEPTFSSYERILKRIAAAAPNVSHVVDGNGFTQRARGTVYLRPRIAVSNESGNATFTESRDQQGVSNSLHGLRALPRNARKKAQTATVQLTTLDHVLAEETQGIFLLKIDAQGHEYHVLQGAIAYIRSHPVYYILLEYYPKGLRAGGTDPLDLLRLLQHELGYQCFDLRCRPGAARKLAGKTHTRPHARSFEQFVRKYPVRQPVSLYTNSCLARPVPRPRPVCLPAPVAPASLLYTVRVVLPTNLGFWISPSPLLMCSTNATTGRNATSSPQPVTANEFGSWTDLLCTRFDLL
jgi:FkbM family methyltransferase